MSLCSAQIARRSPWTCLSCSAITRTSQALIAVSTSRSPARIHQRKHSSSKTPSSPKAESRAIATPSDAPSKKAKPASKDAAEKRPSTRVDRRKLKDVAGTGAQDVGGKPSNEMTLNPPSVPSTAHLHLSDIHMSSFFSIHRPISVTTPIPTDSSIKAFFSIFDAKPLPKHKTADVIYTLSSAVDTLESASSGTPHREVQEMTPEEIDLRQAVTQASSSNADQATNLDIPAKTLHINLQELAKNFRPFTPPPAPVPYDSSTEASQKSFQQAQSQTQADAELAPTQKSYTTTLTIHESTYANGQKTYKTHTTPIIEEPPSTEVFENSVRYLPPAPHNQPFLGRMRDRQSQYLDRLVDREGWSTISVKRQRKLKMKKHKYKKLMKRTKNLRRRLDRT